MVNSSRKCALLWVNSMCNKIMGIIVKLYITMRLTLHEALPHTTEEADVI